MKERVVVLGASKKPERYSNKAVVQLKAHGHTVVPVHPTEQTIEGLPVSPSLDAIHGPIDTLTVYVGPQHISPMIADIVSLRPGRVILNPGTESEALKAALLENHIPYLEACTLVLLSTGQFTSVSSK
jgi:predicted CoA-binding protein